MQQSEPMATKTHAGHSVGGREEAGQKPSARSWVRAGHRPKSRAGVFRGRRLSVHLAAMRRTVATTFIAAALLVGLAHGRAEATEVGYGRNFGLGFALGNPTGFVGKYWVDRTNAWDFGVGFDGYYGGWCNYENRGVCGGRFTMNADYLWQSNIVKGSAQLDWHIGAGARVNIWENAGGNYAAIGARMPVGLDLMFNRPNFLEIFFEIAPVLYVGPNVGRILWLSFDGNLGVRFFF